MNRQRRIAGLTLAPSFVAILLACGNTDSRPGPVGDPGSSGGIVGGSSGANTEGGAEGGAAGTNDASVDSGPPPTCAPVTRNGPTVSEILNAAAAPSPIGGKPTPGTYDLSLFDAYDPAVPVGGVTGRTAQSTIVVTASSIVMSSLRGTSDGGAPVDAVDAWVYQIEGTTLFRTVVCPASAPGGAIQFSAAGGSLSLFPDATHREVYQIR